MTLEKRVAELVKVCSRCKTEKPITDFYKKKSTPDGLGRWCKECKLLYDRVHRNIDEDIKKKRLYRLKNKETINAKRRERYKEGEQKNKHSVRAQFYNAVKKGNLKRLPCEVCGDPKSEGHHDNYDKPLEVRWLCRTHHARTHSKVFMEAK